MATAGLPLWSTTAASNSTADPAVNMAEGMAPSAVNDGIRALMASVAKWRDDIEGSTAGLSTGGTSTAYTVTTNSTFATAAAMSGCIFTFIPHATNGASPTLAVDGLTARAINYSTGVAVSPGALQLGTPYTVKYVHASTEFIVIGAVMSGAALTAPAIDDELPIYDLSATTQKRITLSDQLKVVNGLTEDTSPDSANDFLLSYDASASAPKKVKPQSLPVVLPRGYIDGCILSNATGDATNDISIAAGVCRDSTNTVNITVAAFATGKQLDANWAPGDAAGMRNSAVGITNTTYHIYAVAKADGTQDIYAHTSTTVATVLTALQAESGGTSYVYARLIGSIIRVSNAILVFLQHHDDFWWSSPPSDINDTSTGTSQKTAAISVPAGLRVLAKLNLRATAQCYVHSPDLTDLQADSTNAPLATVFIEATDGGGQGQVLTNTSAQISYRLNSNGTFRAVTLGFSHPRGKNS